MSNRIIICEASEIIANGLYEIIQGMPDFDVTARISTPEDLSEKILATDTNILIINPNLLGFSDRSLPTQLVKEYPQLIVIALVTGYLEPSTLKPYGGVIEIADMMNLSIHTVITHRKNITRKTGIKSVSGLTVYALLNNLIDETEVYK